MPYWQHRKRWTAFIRDAIDGFERQHGVADLVIAAGEECLRCGAQVHHRNLWISSHSSQLQSRKGEDAWAQLCYRLKIWRRGRRLRALLNGKNLHMISEGQAQELTDLLGVRPARLRVIPNPFDVGAIRAQAAGTTPQSRAQTKPYIIGIGEFNVRKAFDRLIAAFARCAFEGDLVLVGHWAKPRTRWRSSSACPRRRRPQPADAQEPRAVMTRLDDPFFMPGPVRATGVLDVGDGHRIAWQDSGAADALPVVSVHGGPGGAMVQGIGRFIDGRLIRTGQFDQRGCGASTPKGALAANSLQHTVADMEMLREHLGIERWVVTGGSWGSTVALAYAQAHPQRCLGLALQGTWLARERDLQWWFHGVRTLFPELWAAFASAVPPSERHDLRSAYCRRILGDDAQEAAAFATRLYLYEECFMRFEAPLLPPDAARGAAYGRIFAHYAHKRFFLEENQLVRNVHRIPHLPILQITCLGYPGFVIDLALSRATWPFGIHPSVSLRPKAVNRYAI